MYDFFYIYDSIPAWLITTVLCVLIAGAIFCIYKYKDDSQARNMCIFSSLICIALLVMQFFRECV